MSNTTFTARELEAIRYIRNQLHHRGVSPSVRQIMRLLDYKSPHSALLLLKKLTQAGIISRDKTTGRLKLLENPEHEKQQAKTVDIPLVGNVPCGNPFLAEENIEGTIPVSVALARPPHNYFLLRACGDSMNKKGIQDGNMVLVRQQQVANNGDAVVALIDDEATVKEYHESEQAVVLKPCSTNSEHKPIVLNRDFEIQGIVVAAIPQL
jgi:repressor LexA